MCNTGNKQHFNGGDDSMKDTKYLLKRGNVWYIRVARPPQEWGLNGAEFVFSLKTPELKVARAMRDKYLTPVLAETSAVHMLKKVLALLEAANEFNREQLGDLMYMLSPELAESKKMSLEALCKKFLKFAEKGDYAPSTLKLYYSTLEALCIILGKERDISTIDKPLMLKFRDTLTTLRSNWMKTAKREDYKSLKAKDSDSAVAPTTIENYLRRLNKFFTWAYSENHMSCNPIDGVKAPFKKAKVKIPITLEHADKLMKMSYPRTTTFSERTWKYLPLIARYTGARMAEIAQLRREDIVEKHGVLCISINTQDGKKVKTTSSARLTPISDKLMPHIVELMSQVKTGRLFPKCGEWTDGKGYVQICHYFSISWNNAAKKIGKHITFHGWRSYAVSQMADAGVEEIDRMRVVGHVVKGTHAIYTTQSISRAKKAVDLIP